MRPPLVVRIGAGLLVAYTCAPLILGHEPAASMSFARASAAMTELATMNWRPSPGWIEKYRQAEREVAA